MKVNKLDGRWVLVTGAGAGIGRAIALDAAGRGGSVAICDINPEHLEETRALLAGYGIDVISSVVDVTQRDQVEEFAALEGFGAYSTTKFAVVGYSDSLRQELSHHNIGVSVVCPGVVRTSLTANMRSRGEYEAGIADRIHQEQAAP